MSHARYLANERYIALEKNIIQLRREHEESRLRNDLILKLAEKEFQKAQVAQQRLDLDEQARCTLALESIRRKLLDGDIWHGVDPYGLHAQACYFLDESQKMIDEQRLNPGTVTLNYLQLAENIELIDDTLDLATSPHVDLKKLQMNYNIIEKNVDEMSESTPSMRRFSQVLMAAGSALCLIGLVATFLGLSGAFLTFGSSMGLGAAGLAIFGLGLTLVSKADTDRKKYELQGVPKHMNLFNQGIQQKIIDESKVATHQQTATRQLS